MKFMLSKANRVSDRVVEPNREAEAGGLATVFPTALYLPSQYHHQHFLLSCYHSHLFAAKTLTMAAAQKIKTPLTELFGIKVSLRRIDCHRYFPWLMIFVVLQQGSHHACWNVSIGRPFQVDSPHVAPSSHASVVKLTFDGFSSQECRCWT